jgi:hypothetical protein
MKQKFDNEKKQAIQYNTFSSNSDADDSDSIWFEADALF